MGSKFDEHKLKGDLKESLNFLMSSLEKKFGRDCIKRFTLLDKENSVTRDLFNIEEFESEGIYYITINKSEIGDLKFPIIELKYGSKVIEKKLSSFYPQYRAFIESNLDDYLNTIGNRYKGVSVEDMSLSEEEST